MNKKLFLCIVLISCVIIAYVANLYPVATIVIGFCLLPFLFLWCLLTVERSKDRAFKEREQQWRNNCDLPHRKGEQ